MQRVRCVKFLDEFSQEDISLEPFDEPSVLERRNKTVIGNDEPYRRPMIKMKTSPILQDEIRRETGRNPSTLMNM